MSFFLRVLATSALGGIFAATNVLPNDPLLGPGVSKELAAQRASLLSDVRYDLRLTLTARDSAPGSVVVRFKAKRAADVILDFRGRRLNNVRVNGAANSAATFNGAHLRIPAAAVRVGENVIAADFVTPIAPARSASAERRVISASSASVGASRSAPRCPIT